MALMDIKTEGVDSVASPHQLGIGVAEGCPMPLRFAFHSLGTPLSVDSHYRSQLGTLLVNRPSASGLGGRVWMEVETGEALWREHSQFVCPGLSTAPSVLRDAVKGGTCPVYVPMRACGVGSGPVATLFGTSQCMICRFTCTRSLACRHVRICMHNTLQRSRTPNVYAGAANTLRELARQPQYTCTGTRVHVCSSPYTPTKGQHWL